jgi:hypothetical protein
VLLNSSFSVCDLRLLTSASCSSRNTVFVEQAREDAQEMQKASKMEDLKKHARKVSANFSHVKNNTFQVDFVP